MGKDTMIIKRVGGKSLISNWIVSNLPHGKIYVDAFGGSGAVIESIINKRHSNKNRYVYNDLDKKIFTFFKVLQSNPDKLSDLINITPYSRLFFEEAEQIIKSPDFENLNELEQSLCFLIVNRQSFNASMDLRSQWSISRKTGSEINYNTWNKIPDYILKTFNVFKNCYLENLDFVDLCDKWDSKDTVFYFDPPYEKVEAEYYEVNKHTGFDHNKLMDVCFSLQGSFVVSYYSFDEENQMSSLVKKYIENGCEYVVKDVVKHMATTEKKTKVQEILLIHNKSQSNKKKKVYELF